jgi:hypothetical protein
MTARRTCLALLLLVLSLPVLRADNPEGDPRAGPELAQFTCRFEDGPARVTARRRAGGIRENRFEVRGRSRSPQFFVQFRDVTGKATLERHETLWPETITLHVTGLRDTLTFIGLATDGGLTFTEFVGPGKNVSYYDIHGKPCVDAKGSAFRIETEWVRDGALVQVTPPPAARANRHWGVSWYSTSW